MLSFDASFFHNLSLGIWRSDVVAFLLVVFLVRLFLKSRSRIRSTQLHGPKSNNVLFGVLPQVSPMSGGMDNYFKRAIADYGTVFNLPSGFGRQDLVVCDAKAISHILSRDTFTYYRPAFARVLTDILFGQGIFSFENDGHRRLRKALTPAFSNAAIRSYIETFNDNSFKMKAAWDSIIDAVAGGSATIEVQQWMNNLALENLGRTGFSHHFGALEGKRPELIDAFDSFQSPGNMGFASKMVFLLSTNFPVLLNLPTKHTKMMRRVRYAMKGIADDVLEKAKAELETNAAGEKITDKSIVGLLVKAESTSGNLSMTSEEVLAQMNSLFFAGYETTSITLTWALIELCRNPQVQEKLRQEVNTKLQGADPTWEEITLGLPYLDAVTQETLRVHGPVHNIRREAFEDDVLPLSKPVQTTSGTSTSEIIVAKGQGIHIPTTCINTSEDLWGPDAAEYKPERWLGELSPGAQAIQGHHHVLSFGEGQRFCLGRHFALANFKSALVNLVRHYSFELPNGKDTIIGKHFGAINRPKVEGEKGPRVPLLIRRVD